MISTVPAPPLCERVLDRLTELLLAADDVLDMLASYDASAIHWVRPHVQNAYNEVNDVMKRLTN